MNKLFKDIKLSHCLLCLLGGAILSFGLYNIHSVSDISEGGVLGLNLLLEYWFNLSPAVSNFVLSVLCYFIGWRLLGRRFLIFSAVSTAGFSAFYAFFELFEPVFPDIGNYPIVAAISGAVFVGVGTGICVKVGGAACGDDALAMSISYIAKIKVQWAYLITDLTVLALSLSYIPLSRIIYSLLTVALSGQIIGLVQNVKIPKSKSE